MSVNNIFCDNGFIYFGSLFIHLITAVGIPLKGVFHGGAVLEDALTTNMRQEQFKRVTDSKIIGSLNLHELTKGRDLDYFMMHSSTASVLGNAGTFWITIVLNPLFPNCFSSSFPVI